MFWDGAAGTITRMVFLTLGSEMAAARLVTETGLTSPGWATRRGQRLHELRILARSVRLELIAEARRLAGE